MPVLLRFFFYYKNNHRVNTSRVTGASSSSLASQLASQVIAQVSLLAKGFTTDICQMEDGYCKMTDGTGKVLAYSKLFGFVSGRVFGSSTNDFFVAVENKYVSTSTLMIGVYVVPDTSVIPSSGPKRLGAQIGRFPFALGGQLWGMAWDVKDKILNIDIFYPANAKQPARIETKSFSMKSDERSWVPN